MDRWVSLFAPFSVCAAIPTFILSYPFFSDCGKSALWQGGRLVVLWRTAVRNVGRTGSAQLHPDSYRALSLHCWFFVIPSNKLSKEVWFQDFSLSVCSQCLKVIVLFFSPFSLPASIWWDWRGGAVSVDHGTECLLPEKPVSGSHCNLQGSK